MKTLHFKSDPAVHHAESPFADDLTLCGDAAEGENGDDQAVEGPGRVSCVRCVEIIKFCRRLPRNWHA